MEAGLAIMTGKIVMAGATGSPRQGATSGMPLILASQGQELEVVRVRAGRGLAFRLATMGLIPGARFKVESGGKRGPVLISFAGTRLILGHGMALRIIVRPIGDKQR